MPNYYCWLQYEWAAPVSKSVKGDELRFFTGHKHGVAPTAKQWESRRESLYANVRATGAAKRPPVDYPGDSVVLAAATQHTRSAHG